MEDLNDVPCRQRPEDFFPSRNEAPNALRERRAKRACVKCPVRRACLLRCYTQFYHPVTGELMDCSRDGIWGGTTARERDAVAHLPIPERIEVLEAQLRESWRNPFPVFEPHEWIESEGGAG